jgi:hypothetical protein
MKKLLVFGAAFALAFAACGDDSSSPSIPVNSELDGSSSVEETMSSSSEKVQSSSESVEESSSSELGDTTTVNTSSSTEDASSSSGSQELDVQISKSGFRTYRSEPQVTDKAYMQPDSNGRISGTLWYAVDNCRVDGAVVSKTVSGDTLIIKTVEWKVASDCEHWADITISYEPELDYIKYIDYSSPYCNHNVYEVVHEPDPGKPYVPESSSSMTTSDLLSSMRAQQSSSSSD